MQYVLARYKARYKSLTLSADGYTLLLSSGSHLLLGVARRAGIAPMLAHIYYAPEKFQPVTPPKIVTVRHEEDVKGLQDEIRKASNKPTW